MEGKMIRKKDEQTMELVAFCSIPRTRIEMMEYIGLTDRKYFLSNYLIPMQKSGLISKTNPEKPSSRYQKYFSKPR